MADRTVTSYSYTSLSQLQMLTHDLAGGAHDVHATYSYNPASQINSRTTSNDAYVWTGLVNVDRPYSVNGLNQLTSSGNVLLGYDARGNLTSSGSASYSYGPENLLAATNGGLSFYYDGVGRLVEYNSSVSTRFFYDGNQMAAEVANPGGGIMRRYVWGASHRYHSTPMSGAAWLRPATARAARTRPMVTPTGGVEEKTKLAKTST